MQQIRENVCPIFGFREIGIKIYFTFALLYHLLLIIFEEVLSHLQGNYKQGIYDKGDPILRKSTT